MSIHKNSAEKIDWQLILDDPEPPTPENLQKHKKEALSNLENFKPNFLERIFGVKKKLQSLKKLVTQANAKDLDLFDEMKKTHQDWRETQEIAKGVLSKDPQAYANAIKYFDPFSDFSDMGSRIQLSFDPEHVEISLYVNSDEVIPDFVVSQTKSGKLSQKNMPKGRFNEMYQDYVCDGVLRVAREALAYLPVKMVKVHAFAQMINTSTGHLEETPIVSVILAPSTIDKLNFDTLDPSDSMTNFVHNMKFSKLKGFSKVEKASLK